MTGEEIKLLRKVLRISQRELAIRLGISVYTVRFWEQGHGVPKRTTEYVLKSLIPQ